MRTAPHSRLTQITRDNVQDLRLAWSWAMNEGGWSGSPRNVPRAISPDIHHPLNGNGLYVFTLPDKK